RHLPVAGCHVAVITNLFGDVILEGLRISLRVKPSLLAAAPVLVPEPDTIEGSLPTSRVPVDSGTSGRCPSSSRRLRRANLLLHVRPSRSELGRPWAMDCVLHECHAHWGVRRFRTSSRSVG